MTVTFSKYHVAGNDIAVIDGRAQKYPDHPSSYRLMASRRYGIGFDQAMLLMRPDQLNAVSLGHDSSLDSAGSAADQPSESDLAYLVFNADGSQSEQCGNGLCCLARYLSDKEGRNQCLWRGPSRTVRTEIQPSGWVVAEMGVPDFRPSALPYVGLHDDGVAMMKTKDGLNLKFYLVSVCNPHAVIFLGQGQQQLFDQLDRLGRTINDNPSFPRGVNLSMVLPQSHDHALQKVYERGVGRTLACGSASCAAIACARRWFNTQECLTLTHPGGQLRVQWAGDERSVLLHAEPHHVYDGHMNPKLAEPNDWVEPTIEAIHSSS